jgi:TRAP-type uncharacterized transport system fused permease subunit
MAAVGYFITTTSVVERLLLATSCILLLRPDWQTDALGIAILLTVYILQLSKIKRSAKKFADKSLNL